MEKEKPQPPYLEDFTNFIIRIEFESNIDYLIYTYYQEKENIITKPFPLEWLIDEIKIEYVEMIRKHFYEKKIKPLINKLFKDTYDLLIKIKNHMSNNAMTCFENQEELLEHHFNQISSDFTFETFERNIKRLSNIKIDKGLIDNDLPNEHRYFYNDIVHDTYEIVGTLNHIISWNSKSIALHNDSRKEIHDEILTLYKSTKKEEN